MSEIIEKYLYSKENELFQKKKAERDKHLIDLGIFNEEYAPDIIDKNGNAINKCSEEYPYFDEKVRKAYKCVPLEVTEEEYNRICELNDTLTGKEEVPVKEQESNNNIMASSLSAIGWFFIIGGIIAGFIAGAVTDTVSSFITNNDTFHWTVAITYWVSSFVSGILMLGFAEIIKLLDSINNKIK
jgi:hypothetical protein